MKKIPEPKIKQSFPMATRENRIMGQVQDTKALVILLLLNSTKMTCPHLNCSTYGLL